MKYIIAALMMFTSVASANEYTCKRTTGDSYRVVQMSEKQIKEIKRNDVVAGAKVRSTKAIPVNNNEYWFFGTGITSFTCKKK